MLPWRTGSGAGVDKYTEDENNYRSKARSGNMEAVLEDEERGLEVRVDVLVMEQQEMRLQMGVGTIL